MSMRPARLVGAGALFTLAAAAAALFLTGADSNASRFDPLDEDVCIVAPPHPWDPASGIALHGARPVPPGARCAVCGMYPARSPRWAAQLVFHDGAAQFFDSPVNLFIYLRNMSRYTSAYSAQDVAAGFVTDASSGEWVALGDAHFVHGSDALGPMRDGNLPAFATIDAAERFAAERGGTVLAATAVTDETLRAFDRAHRAHRH